MEALGILFLLALGTVFVLFGRYRYLRPTKGYPGWAVSNPDHPILKKYEKFHLGYSRFHAIFSIFVGTFAIAALMIYWFGNLGFFIALLIAILATAILKPKLPESPAEAQVVSVQPGPERKRGFLSKWGKLAIGGVFVFALLLVVGVHASIKNSEPCKLATQRAETDPQVIGRLGQPMKTGLFISGSVEISGPSGHADLSIPLSGPRGKGTLYVVAAKKAGIWNFETLEVASEGDPNRIDLLKDTKTPSKP